MSTKTDWNVEQYRMEYESEEHWELRKRFMECHRDKFSEDELVCLAQVFINVEFMGCRYPEETMNLVAQLSQDVAKEFREERSKRLKRTFVKASDAAEAKAKARLTKPNNEPNLFVSADNNTMMGASSSGSSKGTKRSMDSSREENENDNEAPARKVKKQEQKVSLLKNLPFGNFILTLIGGRNAIPNSGQRCGIKVREIESIVNSKKKVQIFVNEKLAGEGESLNIKDAKLAAFISAFKNLLENCFTIKPKENADRIEISRSGKNVINCHLKTTDDKLHEKLDSSNIGYKIMQKLGWSGGGLGSKTQGIENPVDFLVRSGRKGLGNESEEINEAYFKNMFVNYIKSDDIRDLHFEAGFTKDERAGLHKIATELNLKSVSRGKDPNRRLVVSKKTITDLQIIEEVLLNKNPMYQNKYEVKVPKHLEHKYPDHRELSTDPLETL